jgi:signal transduction histidine kinase/CheY-like chemotaxis protein
MNKPEAPRDELSKHTIRAPLFRKYAMIFAAVVCSALATSGALDIWFSYQEQKELLVRVQREQAEAAAARITQFVKEIESQMGWTTLLPWSMGNFNEWRFDVVRLMRQAPALTELAQLDATGREQFRISRFARDEIGRRADHSRDPAFVQAIAKKIYYGPVYFVRGSEPFMTIAMAGTRRDYGVIVGQVNLTFIWDIVSQIKAGKQGQAYLVDESARLIAHPDISLVLRKTDLSRLPQVQEAHAESSVEVDPGATAVDLKNRPVLSAHAPVAPLNWLVFVDVPRDEAYAPLYQSVKRSGIILLGALALALAAALLLTRKMVGPIRALHDSAARIGRGDLAQRISINTGDELEALGDQFNNMAERLQDSYVTLERKVEERTRQLEAANLAKSRFLAAASHDLRQPLHALGLFIGQLKGKVSFAERGKILGRIDTAVLAMNELFSALLDVSKLDAGALMPAVSEFPVAHVLKRMETNYSAAAREKGLSLRIVASKAWLRSDPILLERILSNLVSNAVRYTNSGGIVIGCRRRNGRLRLEVWDTGMGIPQDQRENIFAEFYRIAKQEHGGLGLGLAIVDRLCRLLGHHLEVTSAVGKGSCFAVTIPLVPAGKSAAKPARRAREHIDLSNGKLVVVIDDDPLVLEGMNGLLKGWGCRVVSGSSDLAVLAGLANYGKAPDAIISDYYLSGGLSGIDAIARVRATLSTPVPAFLMTADNNPDTLNIARANGYPLLHKPVDPMALRATLAHAFKKNSALQMRL